MLVDEALGWCRTDGAWCDLHLPFSKANEMILLFHQSNISVVELAAGNVPWALAFVAGPWPCVVAVGQGSVGTLPLPLCPFLGQQHEVCGPNWNLSALFEQNLKLI